MRISLFTLTGAAALAVFAGCTVKSVEQPALSGPSTFAHSIVMVADRDTLTQNGTDFTDIRITSLGPNGQSENIPLRAQVFVDGIATDFGTLSTKTPITPATIRYTAPAASMLAAAQVPTTVTIAVTPSNAGDFRGETVRQLDIRLLPQGVILPTNPNLAAAFVVTPASPRAFQTATFDASTSTNNGVPCVSACSYAWNFGDGTSGTGLTTTHQFRTFGNMVVTLTVTDGRGAQATRPQTVAVSAPTPPTPTIDVTPSTPVVGQDVFFSGSRSTAATGRTIVTYEWNFGDGDTGTGVNTSHRYRAQGTYATVLKATDDVGAFATATQSVNVLVGGPTVSFTFLPATPVRGDTVTVNVTATPRGASTISSYSFAWGDGSPVERSNNPTQSHVYTGQGRFVITVTVTDSLGHATTATREVTVS
jgi:chitodextrinase